MVYRFYTGSFLRPDRHHAGRNRDLQKTNRTFNQRTTSMKIIITFLFTLHTLIISAQVPDGKEIMLRIDQNMSSENRYFTSEMIIHSFSSALDLSLANTTDPLWLRISNVCDDEETGAFVCLDNVQITSESAEPALPGIVYVDAAGALDPNVPANTFLATGEDFLPVDVRPLSARPLSVDIQFIVLSATI